jgi:hypothetical protein
MKWFEPDGSGAAEILYCKAGKEQKKGGPEGPKLLLYTLMVPCFMLSTY